MRGSIGGGVQMKMSLSQSTGGLSLHGEIGGALPCWVNFPTVGLSNEHASVDIG